MTTKTWVLLVRVSMGTIIQSRITPQPALDYHACCQCANQNNGNFYDFIPQSASRLAVSIGDLPAPGDLALNTSCVQSLIRGLTVGSRGDVESLARELNRTLYLLLPHDIAVPWFYGWIDPVRRELQYVNAGHEAPLLIRKRTRTAHRLERTGTALGFSAHSIHRHDVAAIDPGDLLILYSEGVADSLESDRLLDIVLDDPHAGTAEITRHVFAELDRAPALGEDRTFAAVRVKSAYREPIVESRAERELAFCAA